ncbi:hypothetical protein AB0H77_00270 [Streptomyces sp. NPDC050844]|uniref:hypothetical protein n=1 Tax=Streptomyces sp. NPDC050844 TaxID=3155790 RepID=UPI00340A1A16
MRNSLGPLLRRVMLCALSFGPVRLSNGANPARDVLNSTISDPGRQIAWKPAYANESLGADRKGLLIRLASQRESAWAGVLFAAVDAKR